MPCCCAYNCSKRPEDGYAVFMIPQGKRDGLRKNQWLYNIGRKNFIPTKNSVVCELHFTEDQFEPRILHELGKKKLRPNAVPTIFSHRPVPKQRKPPRQRHEPPADSTHEATACLTHHCSASAIGPATSPSVSCSPSNDCRGEPGASHEPAFINAEEATACLPQHCSASTIGPTTSPSVPSCELLSL
ncbi:THAP domain-containing protein 5-like isoform X2 [Amblyomma americanum]